MNQYFCNLFMIARQWKRKGTWGNKEKWEFEVGEHPVERNLEAEGFMESTSNVSQLELPF